MNGLHIVLTGMMGSGKSTIGRQLASTLRRPFVDTDDEVQRRTGRDVRRIFADDGEPEFRRIETETLLEVLGRSTPLVVAVGGGVPLADVNRAACRAAATVVWLRAQPATLVGRVNRGQPHRPLLDDDPAGMLQHMWQDRAHLYAEIAHHVVDVDDVPPDRVLRAVIDHLAPRRVTVALADRSYEVLIGHGTSASLASLIPPASRRVAVVTQAGIGVAVDPGRDHRVFTIGDGEAAKSLVTIEQLTREFAAWGMTRADCVVAVGGGMVTDVAGFAASIYGRGIPVVHVPTTLLGMVDAAIGGKTGVNLPEGKNLVGTFWQPSGVVCDLDLLATLPAREWACGKGEMAKYHFLTGDDLLGQSLRDRVATSVQIKADVVGLDERESISSDNTKGRALLNYGHTLGHALEIATDHALRHGEAVAIGLVYAARLAHRMGRISAERVDDHLRVIDVYGLSADLPAGLDPDELVRLMGRDKKAIDGLTFVLDGADGVEVVPRVPADVVRAALEDM